MALERVGPGWRGWLKIGTKLPKVTTGSQPASSPPLLALVVQVGQFGDAEQRFAHWINLNYFLRSCGVAQWKVWKLMDQGRSLGELGVAGRWNEMDKFEAVTWLPDQH